MFSRIKSILKQNSHRNREYSHGEMIEKLLSERKDSFGSPPVFVETGCGLSTVFLSKCAKELNALAYSLDHNPEKINELKLRAGDQINNIEFVIGDSLENLSKIITEHTIDFLFLDSAASAMHTFQEFLVCEPALKPGACVLVDNAALPGDQVLLGPVRKGKIIGPYLLASPYWEACAHPRAGDSMISAILHKEANYADPAYEYPEYIDNWQAEFEELF